MVESTTQVAVLGAGPGGYAAAFYAADLGMSVTLIDREPNPGGVCVYRGCIPSKALLHVANVIDEAHAAADWGVSFGEPKIAIDRLRDWKSSIVSKLTGNLGALAKQRRVRYLRGEASIADARTFVVKGDGGEERVRFTHAILATGSQPARVPGLSIDSPRVLDSTTALDVPDVPGRLLVVGGGYIGLELGTVYAALGSKVSIVEMTDGLLPGADRDLVAVLAKRLEATSEAIMLSTKVVEMKDDGNGVVVRFDVGAGLQPGPDAGAAPQPGPGEQRYDRVLIAVGRQPNSAIPGLDQTRVRVNRRGFIEVDAARRTAEPSLFAIGDVAGEPMLAHKASHEARVAVEAIAGHAVAFEPRAIPAVVFTDPEVAWCGLSETQAKAENRPVNVARFRWGASGRALTLGRTDGVTKLVLEPETDRVLGVGLVGPGAGELIAEGVVAVEMGAVAADLKLSIHPHPTLSETLMEAAEVFFGQSTHFYAPKRAAKS